ncbi:MAG: hypothetical protein IJ994_07605, partial [Firmicutes bacterium]|nr:hypothetical protein [Bacillota bacterium]
MTLKKLFAILLALILIFAMTACGGDDPASQHALYACRQFCHVERFRQVVVGSLVQPFYLVIKGIACRYYYH